MSQNNTYWVRVPRDQLEKPLDVYHQFRDILYKYRCKKLDLKLQKVKYSYEDHLAGGEGWIENDIIVNITPYEIYDIKIDKDLEVVKLDDWTFAECRERKTT